MALSATSAALVPETLKNGQNGQDLMLESSRML